MTKIQRHALLLALCIALILTGGLLYFLNLKSLNTSPLVEVVIAKTNIPAQSVISGEQLEETSIPLKFVLPDAVRKKEDLIGKTVSADIVAGEQILISRTRTEEKREGLAAQLPPGYRAVTLKVTPVSGVNHKINSGDYVDILLYYTPPQETDTSSPSANMVKTVFQRVEVIDISEDLGMVEQYVILLVKPEDAEKLFWADVSGEIRFALRPTEDQEKMSLPGASINSLR